jgi:hypothetical protein
MSTRMARRTQPDKVRQPVRISTDTSRDVVHVGHVVGKAMFAHAAATLEHLPAPLRINSVTPPTPVADRFHDSSPHATSENSSTVMLSNPCTSRHDSGIPPGRSNPRNISTSPGCTRTFESPPHTSHVHVSRHGSDSNRDTDSGTADTSSHTEHVEW